MAFLPAVFPVAALALLAASSVGYARKQKSAGRPLPRSSWAWAAPPALMLVFLAVWGFMGLLEGPLFPIGSPLASLLMAGAAAVSLRREAVQDWYCRRPKPVRAALAAALCAAVLACTLLAIEVPFNSMLPAEGPQFWWLEMLLEALFLLALFFLGQRHACLCGAGVAVLSFIGIAQYFVKRFKNSAILPTDLLALNTAAAVSTEYVFALNEYALMGIAYAMLAICALSLVRPPQPKAQHRVRGIAGNLAGTVASAGLLAALIFVPNYANDFGVQMKYWYTMDYYQLQGFFPTFFAVLQDMPIHMPDGYSTQTARDLTQSYASTYRSSTGADDAHTAAAAQFSQIKPTVIAVMNESFSDLSLYDGLHTGYEGPQFFKNGLNDALARGTLNVTVHGGSTCNTEFEFLTGNSTTFIGAGKYPYSIYDLSHVDALAGEFKQWGYKTCAIHPNYPSNWNRDELYPTMGFDTFLSIDDFGGMPDCAVDRTTPNEPHCEVFHSGVSDRETYNCILHMLEQDDAPQFFFDVTMSNHGAYDQENIPAEYMVDYAPKESVGEETPERLNEYLSCIERADDDLEEFVGKLRQLDRPVVLVFFGDHQPTISMAYNDHWYTDESEDVHARRAFCSSYVVWANYDVAGNEQTGDVDEMSVDMLAAKTLDLIGAPVSDFQAALLEVRRSIPSLSTLGYQGANRTWYAPNDDCTYAQAYRDLSLMEYLNFATKV